VSILLTGDREEVVCVYIAGHDSITASRCEVGNMKYITCYCSYYYYYMYLLPDVVVGLSA